jgi:hypothetical protein
VNIETQGSPRYLNMGGTCANDDTEQYINLLKYFKIFFAWIYDDHMEYDKTIIQ